MYTWNHMYKVPHTRWWPKMPTWNLTLAIVGQKQIWFFFEYQSGKQSISKGQQGHKKAVLRIPKKGSLKWTNSQFLLSFSSVLAQFRLSFGSVSAQFQLSFGSKFSEKNKYDFCMCLGATMPGFIGWLNSIKEFGVMECWRSLQWWNKM